MSLTSDHPIDKATGPRPIAPDDDHHTLTRVRAVRGHVGGVAPPPMAATVGHVPLSTALRVPRHHVGRHRAKGATR
ncbi:hypothetical protein AADR41_06555 [Streptomyces sp. CLV115]|uniref:hypothetical protein n=1 Tax=Streptomyces sp. CLV115 TaxID=3138502 RepID=UPI00313B2227